MAESIQILQRFSSEPGSEALIDGAERATRSFGAAVSEEGKKSHPTNSQGRLSSDLTAFDIMSLMEPPRPHTPALKPMPPEDAFTTLTLVFSDKLHLPQTMVCLLGYGSIFC